MFGPNFGQKTSHHVMDSSYRQLFDSTMIITETLEKQTDRPRHASHPRRAIHPDRLRPMKRPRLQPECRLRSAHLQNKRMSKNPHVQEDVNGEKLTVKKWWIFGADFFTVWCRFFTVWCRFFTVYKGHKR